MEGAEFWWRLHIGRRPQDIALLNEKGQHSLAELEQYFNADDSDFVLFTQSIMDGIGLGLIDSI